MVCSAERARRTSCHPELAPLRCCLRLRKTTPAPLAQALSQLAQCGLGVWSYQPQRVRPCTDPSTLCCWRYRVAWIHNPPVSLRQGMQKREGFYASLICYHARLVKVKNVSADVSERQALSNLIRCSRSRDPIMKYGSLSTPMSPVDGGDASLAGLQHRRNVPLFPIINGWGERS